MANPAQPGFDDLSPSLSQVTFCVVDLETTGGSSEDTITEFGAVKVRGGEVIGEFQTLVNPNTHIPGLIAVLTGITDAMVADAPRLSEVLPGWLEFAGDSVLVAHNARFDIGFLKRACERHGYRWPGNSVVDTVALARQSLLRDEVPNFKLATLSRLARTSVEPNHRALSDARATVDVLHYLLERLGNLGVGTLADLHEFTRKVSPQRRAKRRLAEGLPEGPGVYRFVADLPDRQGVVRRQVLYVGKSRRVQTRVRSYFTASETRPRMEEMVRIATAVEATACRTDLEAEVLELRLIAAHSPRYNRRSKFPERQQWLKVTLEPYPRLSVVRSLSDDGATYFGPFRRRAQAENSMRALHETFGIRQCTARLSARTPSAACVLAELGRCSAPCRLEVTPQQYGAAVADLRASLAGDVRPVLSAASSRLRQLVSRQRFEDAQALTSMLEAHLAATIRHHRLRSLGQCSQIVAARPAHGGWEIHVIRHGRLAAAALAEPGEPAPAVAEAALLSAQQVAAPTPGLTAAIVEETERIAAWLERPGTRIISIEGDWCWPLHAGVDRGSLAGALLGEEHLAAG